MYIVVYALGCSSGSVRAPFPRCTYSTTCNLSLFIITLAVYNYNTYVGRIESFLSFACSFRSSIIVKTDKQHFCLIVAFRATFLLDNRHALIFAICVFLSRLHSITSCTWTPISPWFFTFSWQRQRVTSAYFCATLCITYRPNKRKRYLALFVELTLLLHECGRLHTIQYIASGWSVTHINMGKMISAPIRL